MYLVQVLLPALLVVSINALRRAGPRFCGTPSPTEEQIKASKVLLEYERSNVGSKSRAEITVDAYFHILASSDREEDGYATQKQVDDQFAVINDTFSPHGISFNLVNVNWTILDIDDVDEETIRALRQGDYSTLNVYFFPWPPEEEYWGYSKLPKNVTRGSDDFYLDGCYISAYTMPGGSWNGSNLGKTTVHEIGHWFNLLHTFHGSGCEDGDLIDDTPAQHEDAEEDLGTCPLDGQDTCPDSPGPDPIHNYMSYSNDACIDNFTKGQADRMHSSWEIYRRNATL